VRRFVVTVVIAIAIGVTMMLMQWLHVFKLVTLAGNES